MPTPFATWVHRGVLVVLLFGAYQLAWTPARSTWITHGAAPLLERTQHLTGQQRAITIRPAAKSLYIQTSTETIFRYTAPAGIKFLLPGLFLLVIAPRQSWIGLFFGGHLIISILTLLLLSADTAGLVGPARIADFVQIYGVDAYSLTLPIFVFARRMQGEPKPKTD